MKTTDDFADLGTYSTVVADPPWPYEGGGPVGTGGRGAGFVRQTPSPSASASYDLLSIAQLCAMPVKDHVERNAHLYLWFTNAFAEEAHVIARAWGFAPKTIITWVKTRDADGLPSMKTGYYFRSATEHALFCVRGSLPLRVDSGVATAFLHPRLPHSVKPPKFMALVEECSPPAYLEVFARRPRSGWDSFGNQIEVDPQGDLFDTGAAL